MTYIIKSTSYRLLKSTINSLTKDIDKDNIIYFDITINSINELIEECNYTSLFNDKKCVIVNNSMLFGTKFSYEKELQILENYLNNENEFTTLIFIEDNVSLRKKCVKIIKDNNNYIELTKPEKQELENKIKEYLKDNNYKIDNIALKNIIKNLNNDYDLILNELDKVTIVKNDNVINNDDIEKYTIKVDNNNIFDFVDAIIKKEDTMYAMLKKFVENKEEPAILFSNIATQYRLMYSSINLYKEGMSDAKIAEVLNVHPYRVKLALENASKYKIEELKNNLLNIGNLDELIKNGTIDKYTALKIFITSI